eukprot:777819-Prorocentrum_minimum.AAC.1
MKITSDVQGGGSYNLVEDSVYVSLKKRKTRTSRFVRFAPLLLSHPKGEKVGRAGRAHRVLGAVGRGREAALRIVLLQVPLGGGDPLPSPSGGLHLAARALGPPRGEGGGGGLARQRALGGGGVGEGPCLLVFPPRLLVFPLPPRALLLPPRLPVPAGRRRRRRTQLTRNVHTA